MTLLKTVKMTVLGFAMMWAVPVMAQDEHVHHAPKAQTQAHAHEGHHMPAAIVKGGPKEDEAIRELNEAMAKMHKDMAVPLTGDADADFIRGMIPHHEGAVAMAQIVLKHGDDPEARELARAILRAQRAEIAFMERWLEKRKIPAKEPINLQR